MGETVVSCPLFLSSSYVSFSCVDEGPEMKIRVWMNKKHKNIRIMTLKGGSDIRPLFLPFGPFPVTVVCLPR